MNLVFHRICLFFTRLCDSDNLIHFGVNISFAIIIMFFFHTFFFTYLARFNHIVQDNLREKTDGLDTLTLHWVGYTNLVLGWIH